jgi:colanic acid/amylovoran biosynthesis protein
MLTNDLAVYLQKEERFDPDKELKKKGIDLSEKQSVAITVRPYRFPGHQKPEELYQNYKQSIVDFILWLEQNGFYPVLIEHVFSEAFHEQDMICINEITALLPKETNYAVFSDLSLNCRQMKGIYSCFDYIIGTRFHSMIFSLMEGVPGIAITYGGNKGQGIMQDIGLGEYALSMESITGEKLIKKFQSVLDNKNSIKDKLETYMAECEKDRNVLINSIKAAQDRRTV